MRTSAVDCSDGSDSSDDWPFGLCWWTPLLSYSQEKLAITMDCGVATVVDIVLSCAAQEVGVGCSGVWLWITVLTYATQSSRPQVW